MIIITTHSSTLCSSINGTEKKKQIFIKNDNIQIFQKGKMGKVENRFTITVNMEFVGTLAFFAFL